MPTLVIAGELDLLTPAWVSKGVAERIPDARLLVLPGTGHTAMLERHAEVSHRIDELASASMSSPRANLCPGDRLDAGGLCGLNAREPR